MRARIINENGHFVGKSKQEMNQHFKESVEQAGLRYESVQKYWFTVKKLKELLENFPDDMPVGFVKEHNKQLVELDGGKFKQTLGCLVIDGFDGYHSYRTLSNPIPVLQLYIEKYDMLDIFP